MFTSIVLICLQLFIFQTVNSQCANRIIQGPNGPIEVLPNQVLVPPGVPYLPGQRPVYLPGPNPGQTPQPVILPAPPAIPAEYLPPGVTNLAPPQNIIPGNVFVPNIQQALSNILPGNMFVPNIPSGNVIVPSGNVVVPSLPSGNLIVPNALEGYAPVVLHDNSVANSLANALQLLVVSSLLSTTLPQQLEPPCYNGYMPGYGYVY